MGMVAICITTYSLWRRDSTQGTEKRINTNTKAKGSENTIKE